MTVCLKEFRLNLDVEKVPEVVINYVLFTGSMVIELGMITESERLWGLSSQDSELSSGVCDVVWFDG